MRGRFKTVAWTFFSRWRRTLLVLHFTTGEEKRDEQIQVFTVDGLLSSVGPTKFDNRSFQCNDEADLKQSKRITLDAWRDRPLH